MWHMNVLYVGKGEEGVKMKWLSLYTCMHVNSLCYYVNLVHVGSSALTENVLNVHLKMVVLGSIIGFVYFSKPFN